MCIRDRSNGAFVLTSYEPAATAFALVKNADYYDADRIALDGLNYQVIKASQQALLSLIHLSMCIRDRPASILQMHPDFTLVGDEEALSLI